MQASGAALSLLKHVAHSAAGNPALAAAGGRCTGAGVGVQTHLPPRWSATILPSHQAPVPVASSSFQYVWQSRQGRQGRVSSQLRPAVTFAFLGAQSFPS